MEFRGNDRRQQVRGRQQSAMASTLHPDSTSWRSIETTTTRRPSDVANSVAAAPYTQSLLNYHLDNNNEVESGARRAGSGPGFFCNVSDTERKPPAERPFVPPTPLVSARSTPQLTRHVSSEGKLRQKISRPYNPKPAVTPTPTGLTNSSSTSMLPTNALNGIHIPDNEHPLKRQVSVGSAMRPPNFMRRATTGQPLASSSSDGRSPLSQTRLQATSSQQLRASFSAPLGVDETQAILDQLRQRKQRPSIYEAKTSESVSPKGFEVASLKIPYSEDTKMSEDEILALEISNMSLDIPPASPPRGSLLTSSNGVSNTFRHKNDDLLLDDDDLVALQLASESDNAIMVMNPARPKDFETMNNAVSTTAKPPPHWTSEPVETISDEELARRLADELIEEAPLTEAPITSSTDLDASLSIVPETSSAEQLRIWQQIQEEQEQKQLERALEESRRSVIGGTVDFVLTANPSTSYRHTGGEEMDILMSQQMALNQWAQRQQGSPQRQSTPLSPVRSSAVSSPVPHPPIPRPSRPSTVSLTSSGRVASAGVSSRNVGDTPEREDMLRRGQLETQQAISIGQAHIVQCQGCLGRLHAPLSYSLVFCPNCHTVSPGLPLQRSFEGNL